MKKHIGKVIYGVLILILISSGVWASNCEKFDVFGLYSSPRCKVDAVYFDTEVCSVCGNNIMDTGVLESSDFEETVLVFSDHFSSLDNYFDLKTKVLVPSVIMAIDIGLLVITTCYFIFCALNRKRLKRGLKK